MNVQNFKYIYFSPQGNIKYSKNTIYFSIIVENTIYLFYTEKNV